MSSREPSNRALVLSGSIGRGHDSVAESCSLALGKTELEPAPVVDCMRLLGPVESRIAGALFRSMIGHPALYDGFHFTQLRAEGALSRRGSEAAVRKILRSLGRRGLDSSLALALSVFPTGVPAAEELKASNPGMRSVVFCTDATVHSRWAHEGVDLYIATCELAARSLRRYVPAAEVAMVPPAVRGSFFDPAPRHVARRRFDVPDGESCVLLVSGGWGMGPVAESAAALASEGHYVLAASGVNRALCRRLDKMAESDDRIRSLGMCEDMASAISASDVVVSATGQTCHEVHVVRRPLVVLDAVPGHGRENVLHEVMAYGAVAASPRPASVVAGVAAALKEGDAGPQWPVSSQAEWDSLFLGALEPLGVARAATAAVPERRFSP